MDTQQYRLPLAGLVLIAMAGLAYWAIDSRTGDTEIVDADEAELPELDRDNITELAITLPGEDGETIRLARNGESGWRMTAPVESATASAPITTALDRIENMESRGVVARTDRHHEELEVADDNGVHLIAKAGEDVVLDIYIGRFGGGNSMIRPAGGNTVLRVSGALRSVFNKPARDWRNRTIVDVSADDARELAFTNTNGTFRFQKADSGWTQVTEAGEGEDAESGAIENFDASRLTSLVSSISRLRASNFAAPDVTPEAAGFGPDAAQVTMVAGEGEEAQTVELTVGGSVSDANSERYVRVGGNDTIFVVSRLSAERLVPDTAAFQPAPASDTPPTPPPGGMPPGLGGLGGIGGPGGPGGANIPPELMQQIQQQLQQQQQQQ